MSSLVRQLPAEWSQKRLGDICSESRVIAPTGSQLRYLGLENIESGTGRILNWGHDDKTQAGISTTFSFGPSHVLYGKLRPYLQKVALPETEGRCSTEIIPLIPKSGIDREFLAHLLRTDAITNAAMDGVTGARMPRANMRELFAVPVPVPPLSEQQRIVRTLREKFADLDRARRALADQLDAAEKLPIALVRETLSEQTSETSLGDVLEEITWGVGDEWATRPLLGATRSGLALAKEPIGKSPERYKPVEAGCIFYNPMRVLIGSIAYVEEGNGIVSPDYVAFTTKSGRLHSRWFYHWLKSEFGEHFIKSLARGAVRERILFSRLADGVVSLPSWERQLDAVRQMEGAPALNRSLTDQLAALDRYPAALLREAFSGRL